MVARLVVEMFVQEVAVGRLRAAPWNPRSIAPLELESLQGSITDDPEMLRARPLLALPDGTVICGNQRLLVVQALGWETVPALVVDLDPTRARVWGLRDNNQWGHWDDPTLAELLAGLEAEGIDLHLVGFGSGELDRLLAGFGEQPDIDDPPPLVASEPESEPGRIYELGAHRLLCGDATIAEDLARLSEAGMVELLWSDPPYGVGYAGKTAEALTIENDTAVGLPELLRGAFAAADPLLAPSARFYLCSPAGPQGTVFRLAIDEIGWRFSQGLVWVKNTPVLGHSDHMYQHEDVLFGYKPGPGRPGRGRHRGSRWYGDNRQSSVFFFDRPARSTEHPTMKPVALIEAMLQNSSRRGDTVLDPFAGSGSTLIACERLGRRCLLVEKDARYCDLIRRRYQEIVDGR